MGEDELEKERKEKRVGLKWFMAIALTLCLLIPVSSAYANGENDATPNLPSDIEGHWNEELLLKWLQSGFINGYPDGTLRPDDEVTRAQFLSFVNRVFGFTEGVEVHFSDVKQTDWAYEGIGIAVKEGYVNGYSDGTFRPQQVISRQEAAAMIARVLELEDFQTADRLGDSEDIASWARGPVSAIRERGIIDTILDGSFHPLRIMTRADTVDALERAIQFREGQVRYSMPGEYGDLDHALFLDGDVLIDSAGITFHNVVINGDLHLSKRIGNGEVTLNQVTVVGDTVVEGGGHHSIYVNNSSLQSVHVNNENGSIGIVLHNVTIEQLTSADPINVDVIVSGDTVIKGRDADHPLKYDTKISIINEQTNEPIDSGFIYIVSTQADYFREIIGFGEGLAIATLPAGEYVVEQLQITMTGELIALHVPFSVPFLSEQTVDVQVSFEANDDRHGVNEQDDKRSRSKVSLALSFADDDSREVSIVNIQEAGENGRHYEAFAEDGVIEIELPPGDYYIDEYFTNEQSLNIGRYALSQEFTVKENEPLHLELSLLKLEVSFQDRAGQAISEGMFEFGRGTGMPRYFVDFSDGKATLYVTSGVYTIGSIYVDGKSDHTDHVTVRVPEQGQIVLTN